MSRQEDRVLLQSAEQLWGRGRGHTKGNAYSNLLSHSATHNYRNANYRNARRWNGYAHPIALRNVLVTQCFSGRYKHYKYVPLQLESPLVCLSDL